MTFLRIGGETRRIGLRLYLIEIMPLLKRGCFGTCMLPWPALLGGAVFFGLLSSFWWSRSWPCWSASPADLKHYCEFFVISDFSLWSVVTTLLWRDTDELLLVLRRIFRLTADLLDLEADEMIAAREMTGPRAAERAS